jgi:hypothetical protein
MMRGFVGGRMFKLRTIKNSAIENQVQYTSYLFCLPPWPCLEAKVELQAWCNVVNEGE